MNKIDLIIDALEAHETDGNCSHGFWVDDCPNACTAKITRQALAAARELKALKPVCVITKNETGQIYIQTDDGKPFFINRHVGTKLYALDEVTE